MKILFFTAGPELVASSRTRVYQYLPHLHKNGIKTKIINYLSLARCRKNLDMAEPNLFEKVIDRIFCWRQTASLMFHAGSYDIVFIQKVLLSKPALNILKALNSNIVFDFDDAVYLQERFLDRFNRTLKISRYIIVENEQNEEYVRKFNPNVIRITGPVDTSRYVPKQKITSMSGAVTIGWVGSPEATKYLKPLTAVFRKLSEKYVGLKLLLIGASDFRIEGLNVITRKWNMDSETSDLQSFDIGIMPLENDAWSRGKGGYKLLQYMAIGIPCVASPVGVNKDIVRNGQNGYLAKTEEGWLDALSKLVSDASLRQKMGVEGRRIAQEEYSYETATPKMIVVFDNIMKVREC